ncbi:hypothetical protein LCGC14_2977880, partial [marine sediment metagenome]
MMFWFNRHRRLRDQLSAYIDGELDASAAERLERHLAECGRCPNNRSATFISVKSPTGDRWADPTGSSSSSTR